MKLEPSYLAPNLRLSLHWNTRMATALNKRYWAAMHDRPEATEQLRREYNQWDGTLDAAHEQVKRFFALTGAYPIEGDELHISLPKPAYRPYGLRLTKRVIYCGVEFEEMQIDYEVEGAAEEMEELEEHLEGDLVDEED